MFKILIISDTHGKLSLLGDINELISGCDCIIHAGDGAADLERLRAYAGGKLLFVPGNCDFSTLPDEIVVDLAGKKFFITHGHRYSVKSGMDSLIVRGRQLDADIVVYGHTHIAAAERSGKMLLINPGAFERGFGSRPSYCTLTIDGSFAETDFTEF